MRWVSLIPSGTNLEYNAFSLGGGFSVPLDKHIFIKQIVVTLGSSQGELAMLWDYKLDVITLNEWKRNTLSLVANAQGNETFQLVDVDIDIFSQLKFIRTSVDFEISFGYEFKPGSMNYGIEIANLLQDLRKIGQPLTSEGGAFDITGDFKQIGVEN